MPDLWRSLRGWLEACHPYPLLGVLSLTALIGLTAGTDHPGRFILMLLAMLLSQLAIGWTNDYVDRDRDRLRQPEKPIAAGRLEARHLPVASRLVLAGSFACGVALGLLPLLFLVAGSAAGLVYNFFLKDTRWSWTPFVVAFAVLPPFVWTSLDAYRGDFAGVYLVASPLVVAVHLANVAPDIESDSAEGRRGIGVRLGRTRTLTLLAACLTLPPLLALLLLPLIAYDALTLGLICLAYVLLLGLAARSYAATDRGAGARRAFRLIVAASVLFAGGWLAAV